MILLTVKKLFCMYFIQNVPFTFDELPEVAKDDSEIVSLANGQKRWNEEDLYMSIFLFDGRRV